MAKIRRPNNLICPMFGGVCPGEDKCAPAVIELERINAGKNLMYEREATKPRCPIVITQEALRLNAMTMATMLAGAQDAEEPAEEPTNDERRQAALDKLSMALESQREFRERKGL